MLLQFLLYKILFHNCQIVDFQLQIRKLLNWKNKLLIKNLIFLDQGYDG